MGAAAAAAAPFFVSGIAKQMTMHLFGCKIFFIWYNADDFKESLIK